LKDLDWLNLDNQEVSQESTDHRIGLLEDFLMTKTKAECLEQAVKRHILLMPVNNSKDILESPQMSYREFFKHIEHSELGETITYPGFPIIMNEMSYDIQRRAPLIGEHNEEIYTNELNISRSELAVLKSCGTI
jgi:crotonobetainyl-CoA:carnitine CoA-transferase CaiB-like acyl-CoA transferase